MKKVLAVLLTISMFCSILIGLQITVMAEDNPIIIVDETRSVNLNQSSPYALFDFVPEEEGIYAFYFYGDTGVPVGRLYDNDSGDAFLYETDECDEFGQYFFYATLKVGSRYIIECTSLNQNEDASYDIYVRYESKSISNISFEVAEPIILYECADGDWAYDIDGNAYFCYEYNLLQTGNKLIVDYADGTTDIFIYDWAEDSDGVCTGGFRNANGDFSPEFDSYDNQYYEHWKVNGSNYITIDCFGNKTNIPVTIIDVSGDESESIYKDWKYVVSNNRAIIFGYLGSEEKLEIPNEIEGYLVTGIGYGAFDGNSYITDVIIPHSVTSIDENAFSRCTSLTSVTIPDSVTSIGVYAFYCCTNLTSIEIPNSVESIGKYSFHDCTGLTSIEIPDSVKSIDNGLFSGCTELKTITFSDSLLAIGRFAFEDCSSLTSVVIPKSVLNVQEGAFEGCSGLTDITVVADNPYYDSRNDCNAIIGTESNELKVGCKNTVIPDNVTSIGEKAFSGCSGLTDITIPNSVTGIGDYAFEDCTELTNITIPNSVTSIGDGAFYSCTGLTSITIPDSMTSIGGEAFYGCTGLTGITIPDSVEYVGDATFRDCTGLTSVTIGNDVNRIGAYAFYDCKGLVSITLPDSVESIGYCAFARCPGLMNITVVEDNPYYDSRNNCNAIIETETNNLIIGCQNTMIPNSVTSIGNSAFHGCTSLTNITIPDSVTSIGYDVFSDCTSLTSATIGNSVTSISVEAFYWCTSLTSITIPNSVTSIDYQAFYGCTNLTDVYYTVDEEAWNAVDLEEGNDCLTNARIHFNVIDVENHYYVQSLTLSTCTEKGIKKMFCDCGYDKEELLLATGHSFVDGVCQNCGMEEADCIESSHPYENDFDDTWIINKPEAKRIAVTFSEDTETESGYDYIYIYDNADSEIGKYSGTELSGKRIVVKGDTVKIRLTSDGSSTEYGFALSNVEKYYENCDHNGTETEIRNAVSATCSSTGYTGDTYCKECGEFIFAGEEIPATGMHNYSNGFCSVCLKKDPEYTVEVIKNGATETVIENGGEVQYFAYVPSENGTLTFRLSGDDGTYGYLYDESMNELAGNDDSEESSFCITYDLQKGKTYYLACRFYSSNSTGTIHLTVAFSSDVHIHTSKAAVKEKVVNATCTTAGSYDSVVYCAGCGQELSRKTVTVAKLGHSFKAVVTAPTCTAQGYTTHTCTRCNSSYKDTYVAALGHTPAAAVKENKIAATYTKTGSYDSVVYCSVCGAQISRKTVVVAKLPKVKNTLTAKGKTVTVKFAKLKKKNQTVARKNAITVSKAQGTVTYVKASGNKKITVNKKTGKITVKKGLKKGTYKVKIKVTAAGTTKYKKATKTITVTIKVK